MKYKEERKRESAEYLLASNDELLIRDKFANFTGYAGTQSVFIGAIRFFLSKSILAFIQTISFGLIVGLTGVTIENLSPVFYHNTWDAGIAGVGIYLFWCLANLRYALAARIITDRNPHIILLKQRHAALNNVNIYHESKRMVWLLLFLAIFLLPPTYLLAVAFVLCGPTRAKIPKLILDFIENNNGHSQVASDNTNHTSPRINEEKNKVIPNKDITSDLNTLEISATKPPPLPAVPKQSDEQPTNFNTKINHKVDLSARQPPKLPVDIVETSHMTSNEESTSDKPHTMQQAARMQLMPLSMSEIKESLRKVDQNFAEAVIIAESTPVLRHDLFNVSYEAESANRTMIQIVAPAPEEDVADFDKNFYAENLENGILLLPNNTKINTLLSRPGANITEIKDNESWLRYPLEVSESGYNSIQRTRYIKELSKVESCTKCNGNKKITCIDAECEGQHIYRCPRCRGIGEVDCDPCNSSGKIECSDCRGSTRVKCGSLFSYLGNSRTRGCNGTGKITKKLKSGKTQKIICPSCRGKGDTKCGACKGGKIICSKCEGRKKLTCGRCEGAKNLTCVYCDSNGDITCESCNGHGKMMKSYWVNSEVTKIARSQTIKRNNNFAYNASLLDQITPLAWEAMDTHDELNPANAKLTDDVTKAILQEIREFPIDESQEIFPRLTKDQISYNVIPIIKVKATHVITDKVIDLVMADVRGETILVKQDDAMAVNQNLSNNIKSFIGKTFKTKSYSEKTDRLSQIKLMIYVAKADGTIDEEEKLFINECVNSITDLTKKEKLVLINMLSAKCLPPLSKEVIVFSSQSKGEEIISSLEQLAQSDGLYHEHEKKVIEKVRMLL